MARLGWAIVFCAAVAIAHGTPAAVGSGCIDIAGTAVAPLTNGQFLVLTVNIERARRFLELNGWTVTTTTPGPTDSIITAVCDRSMSPVVPVAPVGPVTPVSGRPLVDPSRVRRLGAYSVQLWDSYWQKALTHRLVDGELRFLTLEYLGVVGGARYLLVEYRLGSLPLGSTIGGWDVTGAWDLSRYIPMTADNHFALRWHEATNTLWVSSATDYPDATAAGNTRNTIVVELGESGIIRRVRGPFGLSGLNERRAVGGVMPVPAYFRDAYGTGPYVWLGGDYASRMMIGVSLGLTAYATADPLAGRDGAELSYQVLADHSSGTREDDWYADGTPLPFDRGRRLTLPVNTFDKGWKSPAPDGFGRWMWGDAYFNTHVWVDEPDVHGLVSLLTAGQGVGWYRQSNLNVEGGRRVEIHVHDPAHFGEVIAGTRQPWEVQPVHMWVQPELSKGIEMRNGAGGVQAATGMTYVKEQRRFYVLINGSEPNGSRLEVLELTR